MPDWRVRNLRVLAEVAHQDHLVDAARHRFQSFTNGGNLAAAPARCHPKRASVNRPSQRPRKSPYRPGTSREQVGRCGMAGSIHVRGAREHNLKNVDVIIPRDRLTVITGLSGSGKSSLAFDTIYAEGQRRYVESLSAYARQFLELMGSRTSSRSRVCRQRSRSSRRRQAATRAPRSATVDRDPRLSALAVGARRRALLARHGPTDRGADGVADGRPRDGDARRNAAAAARPGGARPQGRVSQGTGGTSAPRLYPREGGRLVVRNRRGPVAKPQDQARDRSGGGSHRRTRRDRAAACRQF